jgi:hypothetical protein
MMSMAMLTSTRWVSDETCFIAVEDFKRGGLYDRHAYFLAEVKPVLLSRQALP